MEILPKSLTGDRKLVTGYLYSIVKPIHIYKIILSIIFSAVFLLILNQPVEAIDYNDSADGAWNTATTWTPNGLPGAGDNVIIDSNSVTLDSSRSVKTLTISSGGTFDLQTFTMSATDDITINTGVTITLTGNSGFTAGSDGTGAFIMDSAATITDGINSYNLTIKAGSASTLGAIDIGGTLTLNSSAVMQSPTFTAGGSISAGALTIETVGMATVTLSLGTNTLTTSGDLTISPPTGSSTAILTSGAATINIGNNINMAPVIGASSQFNPGASSAVDVTGSISITSSGSGNNCTLTLGTSSTLTVGGNISISGVQFSNASLTLGDSSAVSAVDFSLINYGKLIMAAGAVSTFNVAGSWTLNSNATFTYGIGTVNFTGGSGAETITSAGKSFYDLTFNDADTTWAISDALSATHDFTIQDGTFNANTNTVTITGLATVSGGEYQTSTAKQTLNGGLTVSGGTVTCSSGEVEVNGTLTISSGTLAGSTGELDVNGDVALSGTGILTAPSGTFGVSGDWTKTGGTFTPGANTVTFDGAGAGKTINSGGSSFSTLTINSSDGTGYWTLDTNNLAAANFNIDSGTLDVGAGKTITLTGILTMNSGAITNTSGTPDITIVAHTFTQNGGTVSTVAMSNGTIYLNSTGVRGPFTLGNITSGNFGGIIYIGNTTAPTSISQTLGTNLNAVSATYLTSSGDIGSAGNYITVTTSVYATSVTGDIYLNRTGANLSANITTNTSSGDVYLKTTTSGSVTCQINSLYSLTIDSLGAVTTTDGNPGTTRFASITAASGAINSSTFGALPLIITGDVSASGNVSISGYSTITQNAGTTISSSGGSVGLSGSGDITIAGISSATTTTITSSGGHIYGNNTNTITADTLTLSAGTGKDIGKAGGQNLLVDASTITALSDNHPNICMTNANAGDITLSVGAMTNTAATNIDYNKTLTLAALTISGGALTIGNTYTPSTLNINGAVSATSQDINMTATALTMGGAGSITTNTSGNITLLSTAGPGVFTLNTITSAVALYVGNNPANAPSLVNIDGVLTSASSMFIYSNSDIIQDANISNGSAARFRLDQDDSGTATFRRDSGTISGIANIGFIASCSTAFTLDGISGSTVNVGYGAGAQPPASLTITAPVTASGTTMNLYSLGDIYFESSVNSGNVITVAPAGGDVYVSEDSTITCSTYSSTSYNLTIDPAKTLTANITLTLQVNNLDIDGALDATGTNAISVAGNLTNDGTFTAGSAIVTVTGNSVNNNTFNAGSASITTQGNWDNNATFNAGSSTVIMAGGAASTTFEAGASAYNDIEINKTDPDDADDNVTFQTNDCTIGGTLTITDGELIQQVALATGAVTLSDATSEWTNITDADLTLSGNVSNTGAITFNATTPLNGIQIRSSASPTQRNWQGAGTFSMTDVDVKDQARIGTPIIVTDGTNNGNNVNWIFGANTVSGTVYDSIGGATQDGVTVTVAIYDTSTGLISYYTDVTAGGGLYSITNNTIDTGDIIVAYLDDIANEATAVTKANANGSNIADLNLYYNVVDIRDEGGGIANTDLAHLDSTVDDDIKYTSAGGNLTIISGFDLYINSGNTFAPGGNVTLSNDWRNDGTFTAGAFTVIFDGAAGQTISGTNTFNAVTLNTRAAGTVGFTGNTTAATFTVNGAGAYNVSLTGTTNIITNAVTFSNTGTVTLGDGAGDSITFNGGVTATAPSGISLAGTIATSNDTMTLGDADTGVTLTVATILNSAGGTITCGGTTNGAFSLNITSGAGTITFGDTIGNVSALASLTIDNTAPSVANFNGATNAITGTLTKQGTGDVNVGANGLTTGGLTITAGTFNNAADDSGTWDINGNVTVTGTLKATSGNFFVSGNVDFTGGTFAAGSGTFIFDGVTALISDGEILNDVQIGTVGTGGSLTLSDPMNIDGDLSVGNGGATTLNLGGQILFFSGSTFNLTNLDIFTIVGSTVTFDGNALQTVTSGTANIYNIITVTNTPLAAGVKFEDAFTTATLNAITQNTKLIFDDTSIYTITGAAGLNLDGQGAGTEVTILSDNPGNQFTFNVTGGAQSVDYVNVTDSAASGNDITATNSINGGGNDDGTGTPQWVFGAVTRYWVSAVDQDWDDNNNWALTSGGAGGVNYPGAIDTAIFDGNGAGNCILDANVSVNIIELQGATDPNGAYAGILDTNGLDITVNSTFDITSGELELDAGSDLETDGVLTIDGGTLDGLNGTINADNNIILSGGTLTAPSTNFSIFGDFTISGGAFAHSSGTVIFDGATELTSNGQILNNVQIGSAGSAGALTLIDTANIDGNLSVENGGATTLDLGGRTLFFSGSTFNLFNLDTFTVAGSTVTFDGNALQTVTSSTANTYNIITVTNASIGAGVKFEDDFTTTTLNAITQNTKLTFNAGDTYTITGAAGLNLDGQGLGTEVTLLSDNPGNQFTFDVTGGAQTVEYVNVTDSAASTNNITAIHSINNGGNDDGDPPEHWIFYDLAITIPNAGVTTNQRPTIIGVAGAGETVNIMGTVLGNPFQQVASVTADAAGNFRVRQANYTASLDVGGNNIRAEVGAIQSAFVNITVDAAPGAGLVPTITTPADGSTINGATPTLTGQGAAGQALTLVANDQDGNLLLKNVATTVVDGTGNWTISTADYTTPLVNGINYLSVTVLGSASDITSVSLTDPFGIVFDSVTNVPIQGATVTIFNNATGNPCVPGGEIAIGDANPQTTAADGAYSFMCKNGNYYITVSAPGYNYPSTRTSFPAGRVIAVPGSRGEVFVVAGVVIEMDHPMDSNNRLLKIKKDVNKKEVVIGDIVTYTITITNETASDVNGVYLEDKIPAGFKYIEDRAILDNNSIPDPTGDRPILFNIGTVLAGQTRILKYQLVVGSGVTTGDYENTAVCKYIDDTIISNRDSETVEVTLDPFFDLGTIIGKVFWDRNEDGIQKTPAHQDLAGGDDRGQKTEIGISGVQIVMEDGTTVITDTNGQYHIPAIIPGRHVVRINEMTLSKGAYLTTDKVVIVDITPGILAKVNFGVNLKKAKPQSSNQNETTLDNTIVNEIISRLEEEQGDSSDMPSEEEQITDSVDEQYNSLNDIPENTSENHLLFVAMGDGKAGYNFNRGDMEPVEHSDRFKDGFWSEGKFAYYLKGKIKGKYLITSSLDTERDKKELFRKLDPDKYYPVYGDDSTINYDATNTQGALYLLIEWDKSSVLWGNYTTGLTDSEFAQFSRTLYGGKVHLESASTTKFGEPNTKLIVFDAQIKQRVSHNEFLGTGGSLYYLRNTNVIEGSEKVKIEIRDKITGLVLSSKQMQEGLDYEIDYDNGRIIFWQPVSQITASNSIISSHILDGNPVYVVVDYEYETKDKYDRWTYGARLKQSLTDYVNIGGTYVEEKQPDKDYQLKGVDATIRLGENIKITAEQAESISEQAENFVSTDGGLTFTGLPTRDKDKGTAYGIKASADFDKWGWVGYYKKFDEGFSSTSTIYQQGKELFGTGFVWDIDEQTTLALSHDIQKLSDDTNLQAQLQTGAEETRTSIVQLTHQIEGIKVTGEYRHQERKEKLDRFEAQTNRNEDTVALKADYELTEKIGLSIEQQTTLKGKTNNQTSVGLSAKPNEHLSINAKQTAAADSSATSMGITASVEDKILRTAFTVADDEEGQTQSVVVGSQQKLSDDLSLTTDKTYAKNKDTFTESNTFGLTKEKDEAKLKGTFTQQKTQNAQEFANTNIFGLSSDINNNWALAGSFEHGTVQNHDGTQATRNAGAVGIGYKNPQMKASSKLEFRGDDGEQDKEQYLIYNAVEYKPTINATLFAKTNISGTRNLSDNFTEAQYKELAAGVAYRPVYFDRVNVLAKYAYLEDNSSPDQSDFEDIEEERTHTVGGELAYDLTDKLQLVEKLAYKFGEEKVTGFDFTKTQTWLNIHRLNYNINSDWQIGAEYRTLTQKEAEDCKQGALLEVNRKIGQFVQLGAGYNFTEFNDDLTHLDYTSQGPFVRLTATIYDRTPEEIEQARQQALEQNIKVWVSLLIDEQLNNEISPVMQKLNNLYRTAQELQAEGRMEEARKLYEQIITTGNMLYNDAEEYIRQRIKLEEKFKKDNELAMQYYEQGRLQEAKQLWEKIIQEAEPNPILWKY